MDQNNLLVTSQAWETINTNETSRLEPLWDPFPNSERQCKEVADNETARKTASKQTPTSQMSHYELTKLIGNILEPDNKEDNIADTSDKNLNGTKTHKRQMKITQYFMKTNTKTRKIRTTRSLKIAQWNACSLSEQKSKELSRFANTNRVDVICISELHHRRQVDDFPNHEADDRYTQAGIFWRDHVNVDVMRIPRQHIGRMQIDEQPGTPNKRKQLIRYHHCQSTDGKGDLTMGRARRARQ
uniref:Endonuclease/exonuclease/phosphatase domain-containing protein n=1 Tax=Spongospora subterranea TaxID=70186 RepID=A0A0H5R1H9_9EUKA|eukprot:CRZ08005.1 hypothetical protein [Spongospora subterranea]